MLYSNKPALATAGIVLTFVGALGLIGVCQFSEPFLFELYSRIPVSSQRATELAIIGVPIILALSIGLALTAFCYGSNHGSEVLSTGIPDTDQPEPKGPRLQALPRWWFIIVFILGGIVTYLASFGLFIAFTPPPEPIWVAWGQLAEALVVVCLPTSVLVGALLAWIAWRWRNTGPKISLVLLGFLVALIAGYIVFGLWLTKSGNTLPGYVYLLCT